MVIEIQVKNSHAGGRNSNNDRFSAFIHNAGSHFSGALSESLRNSRTHLVVYTSGNQSGGSANTLSANANGGKHRRNYMYLGHVEYEILSYAVKYRYEEVFPAAIAKETGLNRKRVWEALQRLVQRGIAVKVLRGVYRINLEKARILLNYSANKKPTDADSPQAARAMADTMPHATAHGKQFARARSSAVVVDGGCDVVRVHGRGANVNGPLDFYRILYKVELYVHFARKMYELYLVENGVSKNYLRRIRRSVLAQFDAFTRSVVPFFGGHGESLVAVGDRVLRVNYGAGEYGIDLVSLSGYEEKFFVKIYSDVLEEVAKRRLTDYVMRYAGG